MSKPPIILWFRRDLRLADHPALDAATKTGAPIIPLFVLDDDGAGPWRHGGASQWWLAQSLKALETSLTKKGGRLILRRGESADVIAGFAEEVGADAVYFTRGYEPFAVKLETELHARLKRAGIECRRFGGHLLSEPEVVANKSGEPFKVFTPFYKFCQMKEPPTRLLEAPDRLEAPARWPICDRLDRWELEPTKPNWAGGMCGFWEPGEEGAMRRLRSFIETALADYNDHRNRPDIDGTSRLAPHLAFGEIGPRQIWHAVEAAAGHKPECQRGAEAYIRELYWREFSYHLMFHWPTLPNDPFRSEFARLPWTANAERLKAWQQGRTGYPIVDAGMRQLWAIGWMHNRVRMVAASFLTKHLLIGWQTGEAWFWDTLVDADLANNAASWQWVAGSGADAAPYFRVFNPTLQGKKFDPDGDYVRRWVPELASMPAEHIHAPWGAPDNILRKAGVTLGETYPLPIIEHDEARRAALAAYEAVKK